MFLLPACQVVMGQEKADSADLYFRKASLLAYRGVYDSSIMLFQESSELYLRHNDPAKSVLSQVRALDVLNQKGAFAEVPGELIRLERSLSSSNHTDRVLLSEIYQVRGNYFLLTGRLDSAKICLERSIDFRINSTGRADTSFAYAYSKLGNHAYMIGNYDSAYSLYQRALALSLQKKDPINYEKSLYYQSFGIAETMKGFYSEAERSFLKSLEISQNYLADSDPALARLYLNLGRFYYSIAKNEDAYNYYVKAQKVYLETYDKNNINLAFIYWNIGTYMISKGDFPESINYLQQAYFILSQHLPPFNPRIQALLMDLGVASEKMGDTGKAIQYYQQSIGMNESPADIKSYRNLANAYQTAGRFDLAEANYRKSIQIAERFGDEADYDRALCFRYYGEFLIKAKNDPVGLDYYQQAIDLLGKALGKDHEDVTRIYLLLGEYYLSVHQTIEAGLYSKRALGSTLGDEQGASGQVSSGQMNFEYGTLLAEVLDFRARVLYQTHQQYGDDSSLHECLDIIDAAIVNLNGLRMSYTTEESKLILTSRAKATINTGIAAAYILYQDSGDDRYARKVFELSEKSKSIVLLNSMRGLEALKMSNIPSALTEKEARIKTDLLSFNSLIYREKQKKSPDIQKIELWQSSAFELKKQYDSLVTSFEEDYPMFYRLKYDNTIMTADSVSSMLADDQALLEYARTDSAIYISLITNHTVRCFRSSGHLDSLASAISGFNQLMGEKNMGDFNREDYVNYTAFATYIFDHLIKPLDPFIVGKRLILVPDEELAYLSFDALLTSRPENTEPDYRNLPYLLARQPLSYAGSATILFGLEKHKIFRTSTSLLAFAPSYSPEDQASSLRSSEPGMDSLRLLPIKGVKEEVDRILSIYKGKAYSGNQATEKNFKEEAGNYNVLHLAMHTLIDDNNPLFSKMVFTSGGGDGEDGLLNTYELFSLDLQGSLGVLSACNTGYGKLERGEGIMSLARGFFYAGIPSLVMTLWEVDDRSSTEIMAVFYEKLKMGLPTDVALQQAKLEYLRNADRYKSHPSYWAGFVNIGKTAPIRNSTQITRYWWVPMVLLLLIAIFFINRQVYRGKKKD